MSSTSVCPDCTTPISPLKTECGCGWKKPAPIASKPDLSDPPTSPEAIANMLRFCREWKTKSNRRPQP